MRIHRLTLQAIGPFPGRHTIDFDALSAGGLFLLEGPTGAGKSTVIDAVVFALYGKVAGAEASDDRLHSDHADPDVEPFVELTFSTAAGVYRVWRSPTYQRPKRRGGGFTQQNARAKLWRVTDPDDGTGEAVSAHVQEVSTEVARAVVLDREQFTQTVVLPQGQFASFLRAKPDDRRKVLQDVFGTEIYEKVQRQLAEMARTARAGLDLAAREIASATDAFVRAAALPVVTETMAVRDAAEAQDAATALGVAEAQGAAGAQNGVAAPPTATTLAEAAQELDGETLASGTGRVLDDLVAAANRASGLEQEAIRAVRAALERLDEQRALAGRIARRAALAAEQATLAARAPEVERAENRLDLARRAGTVAATVRAHTDAAAAVASAASTWERTRDALAEGADDVLAATDGGTDVAALEAEHERVTAESGALAEVLAVEQGLRARQTALEATARSIEADAQALAELVTALEQERPTRRRTLAEALTQAQSVAAGEAVARADASAAAARLDAVTAAEDRAQRLAAARTAATQAAGRARDAVDAERAVRLAWIDGMAGALADELEDGRPCGVCGSTEHPAPARPADTQVGVADVERAAKARENDERHLHEARTTVARLEEQVEALRKDGGGLTLDAARAAHQQASAAVATTEAAAVTAASVARELAAFDATTAELTTTRGQDVASLAERRGHHAEVGRRLEADRARCTTVAAGAASVAARADALTRRARAVRAVLDARRSYLRADEARGEAAGRLRDGLAAARLRDIAEFEQASLPDAEIDPLERRLQQHRTAQGRVTAGLAEPEIATLTGAEAADVAGAEAAHAAATHDWTAATRAAEEGRLRAERSGAAREELLAALAAHTTEAERAAPVLRTAALANAGDGNETATTLATYVLVRRFEDVVAAANARLGAMSDGRYTLERIDEKEGGQRSRRTGLGLQVLDQLTESPRDPRTLSGGETFYVSLCLALGLADVVRAEAGGIELGTLFVDEGFGSLDPATLDAVMAELGRLRDGGRAVGIVSHVAELKDRIAERIEVRRLPSGASTLTVRA